MVHKSMLGSTAVSSGLQALPLNDESVVAGRAVAPMVPKSMLGPMAVSAEW